MTCDASTGSLSQPKYYYRSAAVQFSIIKLQQHSVASYNNIADIDCNTLLNNTLSIIAAGN